MKKNIEVISLIYKSVDYLKFICEQLKGSSCVVDGWDVKLRIVANDATEEVLEAIKECGVPYSIYNDPHPEDFYLNRVYRCWNYAGQSSNYDNICFVNSDMMFSPNWLSNLLEHHDGKNIPCSRLVESGKLRSGSYGLERDFGKHPDRMDEEGFFAYAKQISEDSCETGGLFMPCVFETTRFVESGMYPEGNIFIQENSLVAGFPNDRPVYSSGDLFFFNTLEHKYGMKHITVFDSLVYHIQEGERDA
jgi:hypothetical protein